MKRPIPILALTALGLTLTACGPVNRSLDSVNQPLVTRTDYVLDVRVGTGGLAAGEDQRLAGWLDSMRLGYGDHVTVDDPSGSGLVRSGVARVAARYGLLLDDSAPVVGAEVVQGSARVIVTRSTAAVDKCPNWDRRSQPEFASSTASNYGCAVNGNLAAMIADPQDLIVGRSGDAGSDARTAVKAIRTFRDAEPTGKDARQLGPATTSTKGGN
jgi:pilus assembly protein CpaD